MSYKAMIGLEMHCEGSETNSKVFSSARNTYSTTPNENIRPYDMGFPGVLPVLNKKAVEDALKVSMVLNCKQPEYMYFERKNYYYPDMPKNYQITQETKPIPVGIYGYVDYECNDYMEEWNFENWGIRYWSRTPEFLEHLEYLKRHPEKAIGVNTIQSES